jgi:lactate dehydrogenase-like 2-hydroxyacid dehydrogenase
MFKHLLITGDFEVEPQITRLRECGFRVTHLRSGYTLPDVERAIESATDYILGGPEYLDAALMRNSPQLRRVAVMGTGTSSFVDIAHASSCGIAVMNTPGINAPAVAEFAISMMVASLAGAFESIESVRDGSRWVQTPRKSLGGAHIGLVGMGAVGQAIVSGLRKLGQGRISYYNRTRKPELESVHGLEYLPLDSLMAQVDLCSVQLRYEPETHHLIGERQLLGRNPGMMLLNFSNPRVVDPRALREALAGGTIRFGFIDGFYDEWVTNRGAAQDQSGLLSLPSSKFVATSHIAAQSVDTVQKVFDAAVERILSHV